MVRCRLTGEGEEIKRQESELEAASWIPLSEAAEMPIFKAGSFKVIMDTCLGYAQGSLSGLNADALLNDFTKRKELIMY